MKIGRRPEILISTSICRAPSRTARGSFAPILRGPSSEPRSFGVRISVRLVFWTRIFVTRCCTRHRKFAQASRALAYRGPGLTAPCSRASASKALGSRPRRVNFRSRSRAGAARGSSMCPIERARCQQARPAKITYAPTVAAVLAVPRVGTHPMPRSLGIMRRTQIQK